MTRSGVRPGSDRQRDVQDAPDGLGSNHART
ncbi:MAG: hypothetical protein QOG50_50 [Actinomycetota bacterium]|nr:hypothetical protein [Actinomycetota bacterium]